MSDFATVIPLSSGRKEGVPHRRPYFQPSSPKHAMAENFGLLIFLLGAALCLAGMLILVFTSLGTALLIMAGMGLALSGKRLLEVMDD